RFRRAGASRRARACTSSASRTWRRRRCRRDGSFCAVGARGGAGIIWRRQRPPPRRPPRAEGQAMGNAEGPGALDPSHDAPFDLVRRALRICDRVVVAIAANPGKAPMFTLAERVSMARRVLAELERVDVVGYEGLTVEFARTHDLPVMMRGLRAVSDFEFEFQ